MTRKRKYLYNAYNEKKKCLADSQSKREKIISWFPLSCDLKNGSRSIKLT